MMKRQTLSAPELSARTIAEHILDDSFRGHWLLIGSISKVWQQAYLDRFGGAKTTGLQPLLKEAVRASPSRLYWQQVRTACLCRQASIDADK